MADAALPGLVQVMVTTSDSRECLKAIQAVSSLAASSEVGLQHQVHAVAHAALMLQAQQKADRVSRRAAKQVLDRLQPSQLQPSCCAVM